MVPSQTVSAPPPRRRRHRPAPHPMRPSPPQPRPWRLHVARAPLAHTGHGGRRHRRPRRPLPRRASCHPADTARGRGHVPPRPQLRRRGGQRPAALDAPRRRRLARRGTWGGPAAAVHPARLPRLLTQGKGRSAGADLAGGRALQVPPRDARSGRQLHGPLLRAAVGRGAALPAGRRHRTPAGRQDARARRAQPAPTGRALLRRRRAQRHQGTAALCRSFC